MRFQMTRESFISPDAVKIASATAPAVVYKTNGKTSGRPCAIGFYGKANRPAFNYSFRDDAKRDLFVGEWLAKMEAISAAKSAAAVAKAARLAQPQTFLGVGDVLQCTWGYDQTNVDYYQVTQLLGKRMVEIRQIAGSYVETGFMSGRTTPKPGAFLADEKPMRKVVSETGSVRIASYASARKITPQADGTYESSYESHYA